MTAVRRFSRSDYLHDALDDLRTLLERKNLHADKARTRAAALELIALALAHVDRRPMVAAHMAGRAIECANALLTDDEQEHFEESAFGGGE